MMEKAAIIYGSVTGATEQIAYSLAGELEGRYEVEVIDAMEFIPESIENADLIILGCSTWGEGELQMDMLPVKSYLQQADLTPKKAAVFGLGDSAYKRYCYAVTILEKLLVSSGAKLLKKGYRCDKYFDLVAKSALKEWAKDLGSPH